MSAQNHSVQSTWIRNPPEARGLLNVIFFTPLDLDGLSRIVNLWAASCCLARSSCLFIRLESTYRMNRNKQKGMRRERRGMKIIKGLTQEFLETTSYCTDALWSTVKGGLYVPANVLRVILSTMFVVRMRQRCMPCLDDAAHILTVIGRVLLRV